MAKLLYLVHRMPYPPNKGDKVRSYHLLRHLAQRHQVFVGTFVDDPDDLAHVPALRAMCADLCAVPLQPRLAKLASLSGLLTGEALTLRYYADARLRAWVAHTVATQGIDAVLVFSSSMAPYALAHPQLPTLLDLVDVDSAKWTDYAPNHAWPLSWLYRREGQRLLAYERQAVAQSRAAFLVTDNEVALFNRLAPESQGRVTALCNGVDAEFFAPDPGLPNPFAAGELALVFTGAMDYWPNIDAVTWFVQDMLPALRQRWPALRFHIVGRSPAPAVRALAGEAVVVSGTVPDVRPYLQHACAVVAPLRLARGVQNKVLEAMAMGKAVVAARTCVAAIDARAGEHLLSADQAEDYIAAVQSLLDDVAAAARIGTAARQCVLAAYDWSARLAGIDAALGPVLPAPAAVLEPAT
ncbi:MAG: sugar transferase [Burkholderiales bacterium PBB5]|nr:MAG: sugar transferase [Burkholderiales bacterium PBB5]